MAFVGLLASLMANLSIYRWDENNIFIRSISQFDKPGLTGKTNRVYIILRMGEPRMSFEAFPIYIWRNIKKIRSGHSVSNFKEIVFLKFFDINFFNFGVFSLTENRNCSKVIFDPGNVFLA